MQIQPLEITILTAGFPAEIHTKVEDAYWKFLDHFEERGYRRTVLSMCAVGAMVQMNAPGTGNELVNRLIATFVLCRDVDGQFHPLGGTEAHVSELLDKLEDLR